MFNFAGCPLMLYANRDWLQHMETHIRFCSFSCETCHDKGRSTHKFWNKRSFKDHLQRRHRIEVAERERLAISRRIPERTPPDRLNCCSHVFNKPDAWKRYAEHVWKTHLRPRKRNDPAPAILPNEAFIRYAVESGIIDDHGKSVYKLVKFKVRSPGGSVSASIHQFNSKEPSYDPVRSPIEAPFESISQIRIRATSQTMPLEHVHDAQRAVQTCQNT